MKTATFASAIAALVLAVTACASQTGSSVAPASPPRPSAQAAPASSAHDACWDRFVSYCPGPGDGETSCTSPDGEAHVLSKCSGHCAGTQCVIGDASCDVMVKVGAACASGAKCEYVSRMGNAAYACVDGKWTSAGGAGI